MTKEQIDNIWTYHAPKPATIGHGTVASYSRLAQADRYEALRSKARELAHLINDSCPESREKSLAFTHLQEVTMFANASIAINE